MNCIPACLLVCLAVIPVFVEADGLTVCSPDGCVSADFRLKDGAPVADVRLRGAAVCEMALGLVAGEYAVASSACRRVESVWHPVSGMCADCPDRFGELTVFLSAGDSKRIVSRLVLRAYDEGFAVKAAALTDVYRLNAIAGEMTSWRFPDGARAWCISGTEDAYPASPRELHTLDRQRRWCMPMTIDLGDGVLVSVFEAATADYPRSHLQVDDGGCLRPAYDCGVKEGRGWIETPWRALLIADSPARLIENAHLVENLNEPCAIADPSWIRPGFAVSDQDNCELTNEDILQAARQARQIGARYFQLDWGWYGTEYAWTDDDRETFRQGHRELESQLSDGRWQENTRGDPLRTARGFVPYHPVWPYDIHRRKVDVDIPFLVSELRKLGLGLCLYVHGDVLERADLDSLFAKYREWGVVGLKPGFVSYGSQSASRFLLKMVRLAAKHRLWLDVHDAYVPDGLCRTYPNLMITEGGGGQEGNPPIRQDVILPFTRCLAGAFDYTPKFFDERRSHAHMAALLLAYPGTTAVMRGKLSEMAESDPRVFEFVSELPWDYDETRVLEASIGEHVVVARRRAGRWFIAGLAGEMGAEMDLRLPCSGLSEEYDVRTWSDSDDQKPGSPVVFSSCRMDGNTPLRVRMNGGGGFCAILDPVSAAERKRGGLRVKFGGRVGEKFDALVAARCTGAEARGRIYEETVEAFRTHFDDNHGSFDGWVTPEDGLWQGEYWGKNMLALIAGAEYADDDSLRRFIVERTRAFVTEFQRKDGYIGTYSDMTFVVPTDPQRRRMCWNLWGRKYTLWALVEVYRLSGDRFFLDAASRLYDQQLGMLRRMGLKLRDTGCFDGLPSLSVLKPLLLLHLATGRADYLESAREIVAEMDDPDPGNPPPNLVRNAFRDEGVFAWYPPKPDSLREHTKAYEMMSCYEGLVEYSRVTGERRPLEAAERAADKIAIAEANAMGAVGFMDGFCDAARRVNGITEYCDVIHWIRLCAELHRATGNQRHLDRFERAFFNAGLAGFYRDGSWAMHGIRSHGYGHFRAPKQVGMEYHQCCVDNAPRLVETIAQTAITEDGDGTLSVNLYADLRATFADGCLEISGGYPVRDEVTLRLRTARPRRLRLRVPGWCSCMTVNGRSVQGATEELTSTTCGVWKVAFAMPPRVETPKADSLMPVGELERTLFERRGSCVTSRMTVARTHPAARILKGPLVLARTALLGTDPRELLEAEPSVDESTTMTMTPFESSAVWGAWTLRLKTSDGRTVEMKVSDFATAADDAATTAFSIWL